jgi:hypothetical protein
MTDLATHPDTQTTPDPSPTVDDMDLTALEQQFQPAPTYEQMIAAVMADTDCSEFEATEMIAFFVECVTFAMGNHGQPLTLHLTDNHIRIFHPVMEVVVRDEAVSTEGSTHRLLERGLAAALLPADTPGTITLLHTKGGERAEFCDTRVTIHTA